MKSPLMFLFILSSIAVLSQEVPPKDAVNSTITNTAAEITGNVIDGSGTPLFGVNIIIKRTKTGTQTDIKGYYSIMANEGDILVFSFVGMHSQEVTLDDKNDLNIVLVENTESLQEVIVKTNKINKKEKSRSYSSRIISNDKLIKDGYTNLFDALRGNVSGLMIGPDRKIYLRGGVRANPNSEPIPSLVIYDGMPLEVWDIENINFYDIEEIEVIKSAAQSLKYGPRAIGGVIVITSKQKK